MGAGGDNEHRGAAHCTAPAWPLFHLQFAPGILYLAVTSPLVMPIWWSGQRHPSYFWIFRLPLGKGLTWFQFLVVNCCPHQEHPGKVITFPKCEWVITSLGLEECFWEFLDPWCECEELLPSGERHRRDLCPGERAVAVWAYSRGEQGESNVASGRQKVSLWF